MSRASLIALLALGLAGVALNLFNSGNGLAHPLPGWLASVSLLCVWLMVAARSRASGWKNYGIVAVTGLLVAFEPVAGLLAGNRCLMFGSCVF